MSSTVAKHTYMYSQTVEHMQHELQSSTTLFSSWSSFRALLQPSWTLAALQVSYRSQSIGSHADSSRFFPRTTERNYVDSISVFLAPYKRNAACNENATGYANELHPSSQISWFARISLGAHGSTNKMAPAFNTYSDIHPIIFCLLVFSQKIIKWVNRNKAAGSIKVAIHVWFVIRAADPGCPCLDHYRSLSILTL